MKKWFLLVLACVALYGCKKPYEKAIDEYYAEHLNDPSSYELIELGEPEKVTELLMMIEADVKEKVPADQMAKRAAVYRQSIIDKGDDPDKPFAYEVKHKFRAKNKYGALVIENHVVVLDTTLTKIIMVKK